MSYINVLAQAAPAAQPAEAAAVTTQPAGAPAGASTQAGQEQPSMLSSFLPLILLFVIIYFIAIRPQQKKAKEDKARQDALKIGDEVVTIGGIHGIVRDVQETTVLIEASPSVSLKMEKVAIARVKSK
ncbi:MAG: preprotein translocase subunit YajC [Akkermansia sp.]|jgi:preprotein translocase subunit YajC|nr:preprotein translocase subunit YajC [Akkermansia sp.]